MQEWESVASTDHPWRLRQKRYKPGAVSSTCHRVCQVHQHIFLATTTKKLLFLQYVQNVYVKLFSFLVLLLWKSNVNIDNARWLLRTLGVGLQKEMLKFVEKNLAFFSREGLRYALEKSSPQKRTQIQNRHKVLLAKKKNVDGREWVMSDLFNIIHTVISIYLCRLEKDEILWMRNKNMFYFFCLKCWID